MTAGLSPDLSRIKKVSWGVLPPPPLFAFSSSSFVVAPNRSKFQFIDEEGKKIPAKRFGNRRAAVDEIIGEEKCVIDTHNK